MLLADILREGSPDLLGVCKTELEDIKSLVCAVAGMISDFIRDEDYFLEGIGLLTKYDKNEKLVDCI